MRVTPEQRRAWAEGTAKSPFNRWLDAEVRDETGRFDLERLYALAERYGIQKRQQYAALNPGQQRMNLGNALRAAVSPEVYGERRGPPSASGDELKLDAAPPSADDVPSPACAAGFGEASVRELLALYGKLMDELRTRRIVRTGNSPVGDYAELLFANAFGWSLEASSAGGHDATDATGVRYQIKARRLVHPTASRQLSAIRRLHDRAFDQLAAVLFDSSFTVQRAILIPYEIVVARAKRVEHTNSWRFMLDDAVWKAPGVRDVTAAIAVAASQF